MQKPILFVNQSIGPLFQDLIEISNEKIPLVVFKGSPYIRDNFVLRLSSWILFTVQVFIHLLLNKKKYSKVLFVSNPPLNFLLGPFLGLPYCLLIYDLYPQVLTQLNKKFYLKIFVSIFFEIWNKFNFIIFNKAQYIFSISDEISDSLKIYFDSKDIFTKKVILAPIWIPGDLIKPIASKDNHFRNKFKIPKDKFLVVYSGNIGLTHPLDYFIKILPSLDPQFLFLFVAKSSQRKKLEYLALKNNSLGKSVYFMDPLSLSELPFLISSADLSIVAISKYAALNSFPSKTLTSIACGTPIIAISPLNSTLSRFLRKNKCGLSVSENKNTEENLINNLSNLFLDKELLAYLSKNSIKTCKSYTKYNANIIIEKLKK